MTTSIMGVKNTRTVLEEGCALEGAQGEDDVEL
jgi:hypothetical protein